MTRGGQTPACAVTAQLLVMHQQGRWLIVRDVRDRNHWRLPGGLALPGESPREAAARGVREEIGLDLPAHDLLLTSWIPGGPGHADLVVLMFSSRAITDDDVAAVTLDSGVVDAHCLNAPGADLPVSALLAEQLSHLHVHGRGHYLEQQRPPALQRAERR